jgi:hypothetical protein
MDDLEILGQTVQEATHGQASASKALKHLCTAITQDGKEESRKN